MQTTWCGVALWFYIWFGDPELCDALFCARYTIRRGMNVLIMIIYSLGLYKDVTDF